jgi:hypothetical protein
MANSEGKAAVAAVIAAAAGAAPAAEQLELMPATRASLSENQQERIATAIKHDRRGRPPGAQNKSTREMLEFVRKLCGDPLERRFRYAMHTPETLAIELSCSKLEAFDRLEKLWADLSRFFYAQQAQVDGQGNAVTPRLTMVFPGQIAPANDADGAPRPPWEYLKVINAEVQQNQGFLASPNGVSHGDVSHGDGKDSDISDLEPSGR